MADHICSPVALPWRDYGEQTGARIPMESTGLAGTALMGEVRGASVSERWQRGVTAASPVPFWMYIHRNHHSRGLEPALLA